MGILNITEFPGRVAAVGGAVDVGVGSRAVCHNVTTSASAAQSNVFHDRAQFVVLVSDVPAYVKFGTNPTATMADSIRIPAETPMPFGVAPGERLSVIEA